jgi:hypothetical protein
MRGPMQDREQGCRRAPLARARRPGNVLALGSMRLERNEADAGAAVWYSTSDTRGHAHRASQRLPEQFVNVMCRFPPIGMLPPVPAGGFPKHIDSRR